MILLYFVLSGNEPGQPEVLCGAVSIDGLVDVSAMERIASEGVEGQESLGIRFEASIMTNRQQRTTTIQRGRHESPK